MVAADASASTTSCAEQGPWLALGFTRRKHQFSNSEASLLAAHLGSAAPEEFVLESMLALESTRTHQEVPAGRLLSAGRCTNVGASFAPAFESCISWSSGNIA
jgi:hypothetical protein